MCHPCSGDWGIAALGKGAYMGRIFIVNSFSINMLNCETMVSFRKFKDVSEILEFIERNKEDEIVSGIGHMDMANIVSKDIGIPIPMSRDTIKIDEKNDALVVAQYSGPRLPEGTTELPDGATISYWLCIPGMEYCTEPI